MKFDYCIGNPPFQQTKGQTKNIDVWPSFVKAATELADCTTMIHPGRWVIPKKQMKATNDMLIHLGLKKFDYYPNAADVFPNVNIGGGVTITLFRKDDQENIQYYNNGKYFGFYEANKKVFSDKFEIEAYKKVWDSFNNEYCIKSHIFGSIGSLGSPEYGYSKTKQIQYLTDDKNNLNTPIKIWANNSFGLGTKFAWHYIEKANLINPPEILFKTRKVMISKKGNPIYKKKGTIFDGIPQIVDCSSIASGDVLFVIPDHDIDYELEFIKAMFMTKTVRFLMSITQKDLYVRGFENVPDYTVLMPLLNGKLPTDEWFYKHFSFSKELISHIESHVSPKIDLLKKEGI